MTSIIFIGDPHFKVDNIPEVEMFIDRIEQLCKNKQPDLICVGGDLLHTHERLHTLPLNKAYELIDRLRKISLTYVLVGNHDMIGNQQFLNTNHWMNGMKEWDNVVIVDKVEKYEINSLQFVFVPYVPPQRFEEALNTIGDDWKKSNCIFAHQEFEGCKMGAIVSSDGDKWNKNYPNVVSGHIHSRQQPQENIYYSGSAMQHAFGESEKNIIACLKWTDNKTNYELDEIDLKLPRKRIIYTDISSIDNIDVSNSEDKIKISVSGQHEEFKAFKKTKKYKELVKEGKKIIFKPTRKQVKEAKDIKELINETDFKNILNTLVYSEKNNFLYELYELVINGKKVNREDILFI